MHSWNDEVEWARLVEVAAVQLDADHRVGVIAQRVELERELELADALEIRRPPLEQLRVGARAAARLHLRLQELLELLRRLLEQQPRHLRRVRVRLQVAAQTYKMRAAHQFHSTNRTESSQQSSKLLRVLVGLQLRPRTM